MNRGRNDGGVERHNQGVEVMIVGESHGMKLVPAGDVLADLAKKAAEYDGAANEIPEPTATNLRKLADLCRDWIKILKFGRWTA